MRRGRAIRLGAALTLVLLSAGPTVVRRAHADDGGGDTEPVNRVSACGVERWAIKTGTDPDARLVNQKVIVPTTILHLRALPAPAQPPLHSRVRPVETTVWSLDALLLRYKMEADSDYHLVLADTGGRTMIAELPAPQCVGSTSPFLPAIRAVRRTFTAQFHPDKTWHRLRVKVRVQGVGFFDFQHGQSGVAPNAIELHPVLGLWWGSSGAPGGSGPSGTPSPAPTTRTSGPLTVRVTVSPNPTSDGADTTVAATTTPGATCAVTVRYASGSASRSAALATSQTAESTGRVSWTWRPSTSTPGPARATVHCVLGRTEATSTAAFTIQ